MAKDILIWIGGHEVLLSGAEEWAQQFKKEVPSTEILVTAKDGHDGEFIRFLVLLVHSANHPIYSFRPRAPAWPETWRRSGCDRELDRCKIMKYLGFLSRARSFSTTSFGLIISNQGRRNYTCS